MVRVIRHGLLAGFIPANPVFGGYSPTHYIGAFETAKVTMPPVSGEIVEIKNATVARIQEFAHSKIANVSISEKQIRFNADCISFFIGFSFVELLFHPAEKILAVRKTGKDNKNALLLNTKPISAGNLCRNIYVLCGWDRKISYKVMADCFTRESEKVLMFDLGSAEYYIKESIQQLSLDDNGEQINVWKEVSKLLQPEKWQDDFGRDVISHATTCRRWLARSLDEWQTDAAAESIPGFDSYESIITDKEMSYQADSDLSETFGRYLEL
jgi:hypothetical protein